jgi:hypothetical protein
MSPRFNDEDMYVDDDYDLNDLVHPEEADEEHSHFDDEDEEYVSKSMEDEEQLELNLDEYNGEFDFESED